MTFGGDHQSPTFVPKGSLVFPEVNVGYLLCRLLFFSPGTVRSPPRQKNATTPTNKSVCSSLRRTNQDSRDVRLKEKRPTVLVWTVTVSVVDQPGRRTVVHHTPSPTTLATGNNGKPVPTRAVSEEEKTTRPISARVCTHVWTYII